MGRKPIDLVGQRFGSLVVRRRVRSDIPGRWVWLCECDCGGTVTTDSSTLRTGRKKTCGHRRFEQHSLSGHPLYRVWASMKQRCLNPNDTHYDEYGGRGITVCDDWLDFMSYYRDVIDGYRPGLELDRIDNNGNYEPGNVRWVTRKVNMNNTRNSTPVEHKGETKTISEWADKTGIAAATIRTRLWKGWSVEDALETPVKKAEWRATKPLDNLKDFSE